jgi:tetratricopeptide (TPR) repeat protein
MHKPFRTTLAILGCIAALGAGCRKTSTTEHVKRGNAFFDDARYQEAIVEFRIALQADAKLGDVRRKLADAYVKVNDPRNALREYVRAADLLPQDADAQRMAARMLLLAGSFEDARARADRAIAIDPRNVDAQVLRGNALAGLKDFDAAIAEYQEAITLDPTKNSAYSNLGTVQFVQGKRTEAEETFKKAVEAAPNALDARLALANFYWAAGRPGDAESTLRQALEIDKDSLAANRALGMFYMANGRVAEAEPYFATIARLANTDAAVLALADYYTVAKRADEARTLLHELAAKNSAAYAAASVRLAALDAADGHRAVAQDRLHEVLKKHPKDAAALLLSARLYLVDGKRSDARQAAAAVIANEPNSSSAVQAHLLSGQIEAASDRSDLAIKAYEQVLKMQPRPLAANLALARLYLAQRDASKAITYAQQALAIQPSQPEAQSLLIRAELMSVDVSRAKNDLEGLRKRFPNSVGVEKLNAMVQLASRQPAAARASFERALRANPGDLESLSGLVQIDIATGHAKEAAARVDARLKQAQPSVDLLILAARAHAAAQDLEPVETLLRKAIEVDPDRLQAYSLLGTLYARQNRIEEAKASFRDVLTRNPKSVGAATMIAMLLEQQKRIPEAEKQYEQALALDGRAAVAANNLAWIYAASNRKLDEALQLAQTAQQQLPDEPNVNDTLGWIYYQKKMAPQAISHLENSVEKSPNDPTHHFHLGMAYVQTGAWDKARESLKRAFALKPDFEGAAEAKKALGIIGA